jgi:hypothetical protein
MKTFIDWLMAQIDRKDEVGFISRLVSSSEQSKQDLQKEAGIIETIESLGAGSKIRRSIMIAHQEWAGQYKIAGRPLIGIFWIVNGEIVEFSLDANTIQYVAGFKDVPYDHYTMWGKMVKMFPNFRTREYDEIPRGRVIGIQKTNGYRIILSPEDVSNPMITDRVIGAFSLPRGKTEIMADNHYVIDKSREFSMLSDDAEWEDDGEYDPFQ